MRSFIPIGQFILSLQAIKNRAMNEFLFLVGLKAKKMYERMLKKVFASSNSTVKRWISELKRGCTNLEEEPRQERPSSNNKS